jgi:hypothetical protein
MTLRTASGATATVEDVRYFERRQRTHDLTVTEIHTYYVLAGAAPVLVHNCNGARLELTYKPGWSPEQIAATDEKVAALNSSPQLVVTKVKRSGSVADVCGEPEISQCLGLTSTTKLICNWAGLMMSRTCGHSIVPSTEVSAPRYQRN